MTIQIPPSVDVSAFQRLSEINKGKPVEDRLALRVAVLGGGCSGFSYELNLVHGPEVGDFEISNGETSVFVDEVSLPFLTNAVIAHEDEIAGQRFVIENPNAASTCGCGTSFSI